MIPALKKVMGERQEAEVRAAQIKAAKKIDNGLSDQHMHDDHNINQLQNS